MKKLILLSLFCAGGLMAQVSFPNPVRSGPTLPATCNPGGLAPAWFSLTAAGPVATLYYCSALNTWTASGNATGGAGTVTSVTGTTNQIAVATGTTTPVISFTTTPVMPNGTTGTTQSPGDNTTKIATTAFVIANAGAAPNINAFKVAPQEGSAVGFSAVGHTWGYGFWLPNAGQFGHLLVDIQSVDALNNYEFGIYNAAGTLIANTTAGGISSNGWQSFAISQGTVTMAAGKYFFASSAATSNTAAGFTAVDAIYTSGAFGALDAAVFPSMITPPADSYIMSTSANGGPSFALVP